MVSRRIHSSAVFSVAPRDIHSPRWRGEDVLFLIGLFVTGVIVGVLGALLGLGGGIFLVPALTLIFGLPIRTAVSTSLVAVIAKSAGVSAMMPPGRGADMPLALRLEVAATAGAILGSLVAGLISPRAFSIIFATVVLLTAGYTVYRSRRPLTAGEERLFTRHYQPKNWPAGVAMSLVAGFLAALIGGGGGFMKVPIMYAIMGVPLGIATATSNFMVAITATASVFVYYGRGDVRPMIVIPTALGIFVGAMIGVRVMARLRAAWLRTVLVVLMVFVALQMVWHAL